MRKYLVMAGFLVLVMGLAYVGCCTLTAPDGTVTKNTANCFKVAQDKVCNASPDVISVADIVINLLKPEAAVLIPGSAPYIALVTAQGIKDTGCAVLTDLNTMIAFIQGLNTQTQLAAKKSGKKMASAPIDVQALIIWRDTAGK